LIRMKQATRIRMALSYSSKSRPNNRLQATANSLRSFLASAIGGA
jgi:hypothetical protein